MLLLTAVCPAADRDDGNELDILTSDTLRVADSL